MPAVANVVEQLLNGVTLGMVYVLLAAGLSIIFGVMDVINFSHGELFALGAYFALTLVDPLGATIGFPVALVLAPLAIGVVGAAIERFTVRPLYGRNPLYHILLTFGLVLIINDVIRFTWGQQQQQLAVPAALSQPVGAFGVRVALYNLFMIAVAAVLAAGTWLALNRTRYGMIVRAGSQDRKMVRNVGIDIDRYYTLVFGFGAALAAVGGIVLGGAQNVNPNMGGSVIIPAFIIVVLGGLGSFRGAVFGGLLVGIIQTMTRTYLPVFEGLTIFLLMIAVLLVKPQGLFGNPEWGGGGEEDGELLVGAYGGVFTAGTRRRLGVLAVAALAAFPVVATVTDNGFYVTLANTMFVWALFALSLDFVMGSAGLVSLGHAMFFGVGAYTGALALLHLAPSFLVALVAAVLVPAGLAWVVGSLSIRVSGVYFAMITLAFAELLYSAVFKFEFTGGSDGLLGFDALLGLGGVGPRLSEIELTMAGVSVGSSVVFYYVALALSVGTLLVARRFMTAPFGSVLQSIGESDERAAFVGYDVTGYKRRAFVISGAIAGLAGGLLAVNPDTFVVSPDQTLHWINSGEVIVMTLLGGMGTLFGPMLGAGVFIGAEDVLSSHTDQWRMIIGAVFVVFVLFVPRGLVSVPALVARRFDAEGGDPPLGVDEEVNADD